MARMYAADLRRIYGRRISLRPIALTRFRHPDQQMKIRHIGEGLNLINAVWPELANEIRAVTPAITLLEGDIFVGGSSMSFHGVSILNMRTGWSDIAYADHLIHEGAHHVLHAIFEATPFLKNHNFVGAPSPIRRDPRPLYGTLHATFVFLRLAMFFERMLSIRSNMEAENRFNRHLIGLFTGEQILTRYGKFTEEGHEFMRLLRREKNRLSRKYPSPSMDKANALGEDYDRATGLDLIT
jgi:HEXXH motif-containing protein